MVIIIQCDDRLGLVADIATVLEKSMQVVFEDSVFIYNNKSVVFE